MKKFRLLGVAIILTGIFATHTLQWDHEGADFYTIRAYRSDNKCTVCHINEPTETVTVTKKEKCILLEDGMFYRFQVSATVDNMTSNWSDELLYGEGL